jgi:hypothetical protein
VDSVIFPEASKETTMTISMHNTGDVLDDLIAGLRLIEIALEGISSISDDSCVDPEEHVAPVIEVVQGVLDRALQIKEALGRLDSRIQRGIVGHAPGNGNGKRRGRLAPQPGLTAREPQRPRTHALAHA